MKASAEPSTFDSVADRYRYRSDSLGARIRDAVLVRVIDQIEVGATILDVGSGPGEFALPLAASGRRVTAIDFAPAMIAEASKRANAAGHSIDMHEWDITQGPMLNVAPFDAAIAISGPLNYAEDPRPLVANIVAMLRPGASVFFGLPRAGFVPYALRHPRLLLLPMVSSEPQRLRGQVQGAPLDVFVWDPIAFARRVAAWVDVSSINAIVLSPWLPPRIDVAMGRLPGLRRVGALSLVAGTVRTDAPRPPS